MGVTRLHEARGQYRPILGKCPAHDYRVIASMGPKGLTRLVLRMTTPEHPIAEELAGSAGFLYKASIIESLQNDLRGELPQVVPDFVDFTAEYRGYAVAIGYNGG